MSRIKASARRADTTATGNLFPGRRLGEVDISGHKDHEGLRGNVSCHRACMRDCVLMTFGCKGYMGITGVRGDYEVKRNIKIQHTIQTRIL